MFFWYLMKGAVIIFFLHLAIINGFDRQLELTINEGCASCNNNTPWIVTTRGVNEENLFFHLWGAIGCPSVISVLTKVDGQLIIDWDDFISHVPGSVKFDSNVDYAFGISFPYLILFDDESDKGIFDISANKSLYIPMTDFTWNINDDDFYATDTNSYVVFKTNKFRGKPLQNDTYVSLKVEAFGTHGRDSDLPHLLHTPDSNQIKLVLQNLTLDFSLFGDPGFNNFSNPRWGLEAVISTTESDPVVILTSKTSLDDEYTPGVFHLNEITTKQARNSGNGGYVQYRPVSYLTDEQDINKATIPNINGTFVNLKNLSEPLLVSLSYALFGESLATKSLYTYVSFGEPKDGFYSDTNYTSWTFTDGYGSPPVEEISSNIIILISVGLGIPIVSFLIGSIYIVVHKIRARRTYLLDNQE